MTKELYESLQASLSRDLLAFLPELILCGTIVFLLVIRLFSRFDRQHLGGVALALTFLAFGVSVYQWLEIEGFDPRQDVAYRPRFLEMFSGLLIYDNFTIFLRLF